MKRARDFRAEAREALRGKWLLAILAGLIAMLLGGSSGGGVSFNFDVGDMEGSVEFAGREFFTFGGEFDPQIASLLFGAVSFALLIALALGVVYFVLASIVKVGYASFNLTLIDRLSPSIEQLFSYFSHWKTAVLANLWVTLCNLGLALLFVIPYGIALWFGTFLIADVFGFFGLFLNIYLAALGLVLLFILADFIVQLTYGMTPYILSENPEMGARDAIRASKEMMRGNRRRLFCLELSFIGWEILSLLTFGIGSFVLTPYIHAAKAAFYRDLSGAQPRDNEFTLPDLEF